MPTAPAASPITTSGNHDDSGDAMPFAALLVGLEGLAAQGAGSALGLGRADPPRVASYAVVDGAPAVPEPGQAGEQPAMSTPLLVQAMVGVMQHGGTVAPTTAAVGKGCTMAGGQAAQSAPAPAGVFAGKPASASTARQGCPEAGDLAAAPAQGSTVPMASEETPHPAAVHGPTEMLGADPVLADSDGAATSFVHLPSVAEAQASKHLDATLQPGVPSPMPSGESLAHYSAPQDALLPRSAAPPPVRQVAQLAVVLTAGGEDEDSLSVALDPVELGRVEVSIERQGGSAQVRVTAERPETLALLQRDHRELDRLLGQSGIGEEGRSLSFGLASDGGGTSGGHGREAPRHGDAPAPIKHVTELAPRPILGLIDLAV